MRRPPGRMRVVCLGGLGRGYPCWRFRVGCLRLAPDQEERGEGGRGGDCGCAEEGGVVAVVEGAEAGAGSGGRGGDRSHDGEPECRADLVAGAHQPGGEAGFLGLGAGEGGDQRRDVGEGDADAGEQ